MAFEEDRTRLSQLVQASSSLLHWLVFDANGTAHSRIYEIFGDGWDGIARRFERCQSVISEIRNDADALWCG